MSVTTGKTWLPETDPQGIVLNSLSAVIGSRKLLIWMKQLLSSGLF
ncbi:hypothetical protein [Larkinella bovis]